MGVWVQIIIALITALPSIIKAIGELFRTAKHPDKDVRGEGAKQGMEALASLVQSGDKKPLKAFLAARKLARGRKNLTIV